MDIAHLFQVPTKCSMKWLSKASSLSELPVIQSKSRIRAIHFKGARLEINAHDLNLSCHSKVSTGPRVLFVDDTCHSIDFIGLPVKNNTDTWGRNVKVGIIDSAESFPAEEIEFNFMQRTPEKRNIHDCERFARLSRHGVLCTSIVAGKLRDADFHDFFEGRQKFRGLVPSAEVYTYAVGCGTCAISYDSMERAFDDAIRDKLHIISMSQGIYGARFENFEEDCVGKMTLKAYKSGILTCLPAGNNGPLEETTNYGMPWCITVGACTIGRSLVTGVEIGGIGTLPPGENELRKEKIGDEEIKIICDIQGESYNLTDSEFRELRFIRNPSGTEGILYLGIRQPEFIFFSNIQFKHRRYKNTFELTKHPFTIISAEDSEKLWNLQKKIRPNALYVRISRSRIQSDERNIFVPEFSARGPSYLYQENIVPDVVAPGCLIVASCPNDIPLSPNVRLYGHQMLATGTSVACPHVAGAAAYVKFRYPDWSPSVLKSALITTADSLAAKNIPGNEFSFGAGLIRLDKACDPGLVYEETAHNFELYRNGECSIHKLNLPTFAASFAPSHEISSRTFLRSVRNVGKDGKVTYKADYNIYYSSLDPEASNKASIKAVPDILTFEKKDEIKEFKLVVKVRAHALGYISAALLWHGVYEDDKNCSYDVVSPIILYQKTRCDRATKYNG